MAVVCAYALNRVPSLLGLSGWCAGKASWRDIIGRNGLPDLNLSGAVFKYKVVHKCTWYLAEMLKGLSWGCLGLHQCCVDLGVSTCKVADRGGGPHSQKGGQEGAATISWVSHCSHSLGKFTDTGSQNEFPPQEEQLNDDVHLYMPSLVLLGRRTEKIYRVWHCFWKNTPTQHL